MFTASGRARRDIDNRYSFVSLLNRASVLRLGSIGIAVIALFIAFAWSGGWLSPGRLDQTRMIDAFEATNGKHPGFRRNHSKGICLTGYFDSNGAGERYSTAVVFKPGRVPLFGRFALAGGMPMMPDRPNSVRSMALNFALADGEVWRTGMNDIPVFAFKDARGFYDQLVAMKPDPNTGKPDPSHISAFRNAHPETVRALAIIRAHPFSSGFSNATYNSLNAFRFTDADGVTRPVRWSMVPVDAFAAEPVEPPHDEDYLFDELAKRIQNGPAQWHLILTIGNQSDPTNDATRPWPDNREHVDAGLLTVTGTDAEHAGNCRDINFDPLVLPSGIAPSDDPLLPARSAAYSVSFTRRVEEQKSPSEVQMGSGS